MQDCVPCSMTEAWIYLDVRYGADGDIDSAYCPNCPNNAEIVLGQNVNRSSCLCLEDYESWNINGGICRPCRDGKTKYGLVNELCQCDVGYTETDGKCNICPIGTYKDSRGNASCSTCTKGTYQDNPGSISCKPCLGGTYQDTNGSSLCTQCPPGKYQNDYGSSSCKQCLPGKY